MKNNLCTVVNCYSENSGKNVLVVKLPNKSTYIFIHFVPLSELAFQNDPRIKKFKDDEKKKKIDMKKAKEEAAAEEKKVP